MVALSRTRWRRADRRGKDARRWEEALASQARCAGARDIKKDERDKVSGEERENRTTPRRAIGRLSGPSYRGPGARHSWSGRWGTNVPGTHGREGEAGHHVPRERPTGETVRAPTVTPQRQRMAAQAARAPDRGVTTLAHRRDVDVLREAYDQTNKASAAGMDGVTATRYAAHLDGNLRDLPTRLRRGGYQAAPVERVWIAKADGGRRSISEPAFEDTMVHRAVTMVREAIYEQDGYEGA